GLQLAADPLMARDREEELGPGLLRALPEEVGASTDHLAPLLHRAMTDSAWPGGVLLAAKDGRIFAHEAFGYHTYARRKPTTRGDIFDLASITKVVATTSAVMKLYDEGRIDLDASLATYLPRFRGPDAVQTRLKSEVTIRQVLYHGSGLPAWKAYYREADSADDMLEGIYATPLDTLPGTRALYSGVGLMLLGELVEAVSGETLDAYVKRQVFDPLGMGSTYFNPPAARLARIVPTEYSETEGSFVRGHVHDENAHTLGGVAGNAGLFSTAANLAIFAQMMLNLGAYRDSLIFLPETVELFTRRANAIPESARCLGWDSPEGEASAGIYADPSSFGHTGFTGTSLWIDPSNRLFVILLTNAVHPHRAGKDPHYYDWRQRIHSAVYESFPAPQRNPEVQLKPRWAAGSH
ncbi:MAG: serine hydrolase, partial [Candidatus Neomarinimicrobiota bacterium]